MDLNDFICRTADADTEMEALTVRDLLSEEAEFGFICTYKDRSEFTESKSINEGIINTQPEISVEKKSRSNSSHHFLLGDHPGLGRLIIGQIRTLHQRLLEEMRLVKERSLTEMMICISFSAAATIAMIQRR